MITTNCNTIEHNACGCTPSFSSYVNNSVSVLSVGNLLGGSCTFTSYVIDWYRNGIHSLVSGTLGSAPDVTAIHPFTGTGSIPVEGGTWVPKIRWVEIGGQKLYSEPKPCKTWCSSLTGLPTITVLSLNCTNYNNYSLNYVSTQDYSLATRTLKWNLDPSSKYLVVKFTAEMVADKIEVFYKDSTSPLSSWIVGYNNNSDYDSSMPYRNYAWETSFLTTFPDYTEGDYGTIKITPSVLETNYNTNWTLNIKCFSPTTDWAGGCTELTSQYNNLLVDSSLRLVHDPSNCKYVLKGFLQTPYTLAQQNANPVLTYLAKVNAYNYAYYNNTRTTGEVGVNLPYSLSYNAINNSGA